MSGAVVAHQMLLSKSQIAACCSYSGKSLLRAAAELGTAVQIPLWLQPHFCWGLLGWLLQLQMG